MIKKLLLSFFLICGLLLNLNCSAKDKKHDPICKKYGFTLEEEREIGFQSILVLIKKYGYYKNPLVNQYVTSVGETIASKISKRTDIKYRFIILDSSEINAFAAPGGFVLITRGTLNLLDNEAELAGVLAHEISHVEEGHGLESIASDPAIKEKLKLLKGSVDSGEGLSQRLMDSLDKELKKNKGAAALVNFDKAINADSVKEGKVF
ncbi:MAG: M48 family metalloprotease [bacterium]